MKQILFLAIGLLGYVCLNAQIYLKPIITSESSPGACDASMTVIPYGGTPPYSVEWYGEGTWLLSSGFTAENLCAGEIMRITIIDANCTFMEYVLRIATDPANQTVLDTIILAYPTPSNNDGSLEFVFSNLPPSYGSYFLGGIYSGPSSLFSFTNLISDDYVFGISGGGSPLEIRLPLLIEPKTPCNTYRTSVIPEHFSSYLQRSPECIQVEIPMDTLIFGDTTGMDTSYTSFCNGSIIINTTTPISGDIYNLLYYQLDGGAAEVGTSDSLTENFVSLCRGPYTVQTYNTENGFNFYNITTFFIQDSLDITYHWNLPDTIPINIDTVVMDALNVPIINYSLPIDTAFISGMNYLGADQYEIITALVQSSDTFLVYTTEFLDTNYNYFLDITTFEGDSLMCDVNNAYRHVIYFEWMEDVEEPCDSVLICHIPPGNPSNAHSIWVPCENVANHLAHGDVLGDCSEAEQRMALLTNGKEQEIKVYPNPFQEQLILVASLSIERVEIYSLEGKMVFSSVINKTDANIDTKGLEPSVYVMKISYTNGTSAMRKLIKLMAE